MLGGNKAQSVNGRPVGVMIPEGQRTPAPADTNTKYAPAGKVTNVMPCAMVLVRYGDKDGMAHEVCLLQVGSGKDARFFMPLNAEQWTKELKPVAPWLAKELEVNVAQLEAPNEVPTQDTVDIAAGGGPTP